MALAPKMCPDKSQAFKEVSSSQAVTVGSKKSEPIFFFLDEPFPGAPRHVCTKFRANIRRTDCVGQNNESNLTPKIESTLKPSNYDAKP